MIRLYGISGVILALNITSAIIVVTLLVSLKKYALFSIKNIIKNPILAALVAAGIIWFSGISISNSMSFKDLISISVIFVSTYMLVLSFLEYVFIKEVTELIVRTARSI